MDEKQGYFVRAAKASDVTKVTAMWELMASQHQAYDGEVWCWSQDAPLHWAQWYRDLLRKREMVLSVAQDASGELIGFAIASCKDNPNVFTVTIAGEVWDLFVHPDHRNRGVGRALMVWTFDTLKFLGAEDVKLHVSLANPAAVHLYETLGLRPVMYRMYKRL